MPHYAVQDGQKEKSLLIHYGSTPSVWEQKMNTWVHAAKPGLDLVGDKHVNNLLTETLLEVSSGVQ